MGNIGFEPIIGVGGESAPVVRTLPRVCALGDSITAAAINSSSTTMSFRGFGFMAWLPSLLNQRISYEAADNFGVAGDTTAMMMERLPSVLARTPTWCVVLAGTNDVPFVVGGSLSYEKVIANLTTIYETLLAARIGVIAVPILNRETFTGFDATQIASAQRVIGRINAWIASYAAGREGGFRVIDPRSVWTDATGLPTTDTAYDGLHPNTNGAFLIAQSIATQIDGDIPKLDRRFLDPFDLWNATDNPTGNLLTNGELAGTGGTLTATDVTGDVPTSWTFVRTPTTALGGVTTISKEARTDGVPGEWTVVEFASTSGSFGLCNFNLRQILTVDDVTISAGDEIDFSAEIVWSNTAGMLGAMLQATENDGSTNLFYSAVSGPALSATSIVVPASGSGLFKAPRFTVRPAGGVGSRTIQFIMQVAANTDQAGGTTARVKFGGAQARKVTPAT